MNHEETIFEQALGIGSPTAREEFLRGACAGNDAMFERVQCLLRAHDRAGKFLEHDRLADGAPAFGVPPSGGPPPPPAEAGTPSLLTEKPGDRIGRYKLLQKIGEGGCGIVYMAEQEEPVRRRVALKIIKLGMDTRQVIARFEAERQALALMDHPNIAKVFDAGVTESPVPDSEGRARHSVRAEPQLTGSGAQGTDAPYQSQIGNRQSEIRSGRPYFVMELVRGVKITEYCDEKKLTTQQRLELFTQVCRAVQHAHQKGIIHRDLKPSNILVSFNDGVAVPKVIDFGIAKATTGEPLTDKTVFTAFEQFIGTPAYMSPEQALVSSLDIDTRTDIYALGVLLYELLTGHTPFDPKELLQAGLEVMRRTICEREPERPSTRVTDLVAADVRRLTTLSEKDRASSRRLLQEKERLVSQLRGDLDWIVMKCLEKDRARRYETANGLATDIQHHLNNEPVVACPPSKLYKFQKLVHRNKLAFAAGAGIAAALVIGLAMALWQSIEKTRAYNRAVAAEREQFRLRGEAEAERNKAQSEAAKSRQVAQFLADMFHGVAPSVALGRDTALLKDILDKAAERIGTELTDQPLVEIELRASLADAYNELGLFREEEAMAYKGLELARARFAADSAPMAEALCRMAMALNDLGQLKEGEAAARESVAIRRKLLAARQDGGDSTGRDTELRITDRFDPNNLYHSLSELGSSLYKQEEYEQAETAFREAVALARKVRGDEHEDVATQLGGLGLALWKKGDLPKAEEVVTEALAISRRLYSTNAHPYLARHLNNLGLILKHQGKLADAEALYLESLEMTKKMIGTEHRGVAIGLHNLAGLARAQNRLADAERLTRDTVAMFKRLGTDETFLASDLCFLGEILRDERKYDEACDAVSESLALRRKVLGNDSVEVAYTLIILASILECQGKMADSELLARECLAIYEAKTPDHWRVFEARGLLGATLLAQKKYADAEPLLLSGYEGMKQREDTAPKAVRRGSTGVLQDLVRFYTETGRPDRAAEWKQKLAEFEKAANESK